jgi:hypothetical protein
MNTLKFNKIAMYVLLVIALLGVTAQPAFANGEKKNPQIYVIHGINGVDLGAAMALPVDISVSGVGCALKAFEFTKTAGPISLPKGDYTIQVFAANAGAPCSGSPILQNTFSFEKGNSYTLIAHLTAAGTPALSMFMNDISFPGNAKTRFTFTHAAYAPAVDILLSRGNFSKTFSNVPNGASGSVAGSPGNSWSVTVNLAGTTTTVLGPATLKGKAGTVQSVFVVGSATNGLYPVILNIPMVRGWTRG